MNKHSFIYTLILLFALSSCIGDEFTFDEVNTEDWGINPGVHLKLVQAKDIELGNFIDLSNVNGLEDYDEDEVTKWVFVQEEKNIATIDFQDTFDEISTKIDKNMTDLSHNYKFVLKDFMKKNVTSINTAIRGTLSPDDIDSMSDLERKDIWKLISYEDVSDDLVSVDERYITVPTTDGLALHGINLDMTITVTWNGFPYRAKIEIDIENVTSESEPEINIQKDNSTSFTDNKKLNDIDAVIDADKMELNIISKITILELPAVEFDTNINIAFSDIAINNITGEFSNIKKNFNEEISIDLGDLGDFTEGTSFLKPEITLAIANPTDLVGTADVEIAATMDDESSRTITLNEPLTLVGNQNQNLTIDTSNSNIGELLDGTALPTGLAINGTNIVQSEGDATITATDALHVDYQVRIPLYLKMTGMEYSDIEPFEMNLSESDQETYGEISNLSLGINYSSNFPLNATIMLELQDESGTIYDRIELENAIPAAEVNEKGLVATMKEGSQTFEITDKQVQNLIKAYLIQPTIKLDSNDKGIELITTSVLSFSLSLTGNMAF
ncbi:MAG: hypothetical protein ACK5LR_00095 [Mangrovibacterium sp.]